MPGSEIFPGGGSSDMRSARRNRHVVPFPRVPFQRIVNDLCTSCSRQQVNNRG